MDRSDLKQYRYNQAWILERIDYIEEQRAMLTKITTTLSDMPKGFGTGDKLAENIAKMIDNLNELSNRMVEMQEKQKKILEALELVEQPYRMILDKYYVQGKTLVTITCEMNYNYEHMKRMHGISLNKFDDATKCY